MGKPSRDKGAREERRLVSAHLEVGIQAERVPLSGGVGYKGNVGDIDIYAFGADAEPIVAEVKVRKDGGGFKTLEAWMGDHAAMFLRRDGQDPMVVITWDLWVKLITGKGGKDVL